MIGHWPVAKLAAHVIRRSPRLPLALLPGAHWPTAAESARQAALPSTVDKVHRPPL
jgi:hypothetical protein